MFVDYYRRDRDSGITAPDLSKECTFAEHIVKARGKRSQFTSVSLNAQKIRDFGPCLYRLLRDDLQQNGHALVENAELLVQLRMSAAASDKEERLRAIQAQRYVRSRQEGLIQWSFDAGGVERKNVIAWGYGRIQRFFARA